MPRFRVLPEGIVWDIVRLQGAEQQCPLIDLATVKDHLEELAGRTIPRAVAARLLCLSQTALDQWVERGDIPVVLTPSGRREVPSAAGARAGSESRGAAADRRSRRSRPPPGRAAFARVPPGRRSQAR